MVSTSDRSESLQALAAVAPLPGEVDGVLLGLVKQARQRGATWEEVGQALGLSKQTAHARYSRFHFELADDPEAEDAPAP